MPPRITEPPATDFMLHFTWGLGFDSHDPTRWDRERQCLQGVLHRWTAPERHYHSLHYHLVPLIAAMGKEDTTPWEGRVAVIAAFYHDAVMERGLSDSDNVEASALLWDKDYRFMAGDGEPPSSMFGDAVHEAILATDYSQPPPKNNLMLRNFDLLGLSSPWDTYKANGELIKREYTRPDEPQTKFLHGRMEWLIKMLTSGPIYLTKNDIWADRETCARRNLGQELAELLSTNSPTITFY